MARMAAVGDDEVDQESIKWVKVKKPKGKVKPAGIIYLSRIPAYMSVKNIRQILGQYGEIGRLFLQPDEKATGKKKNRMFSEGWIEFMDKKIAKQIAVSLNNTQVGGKRRSPWYEEIWNLRYMHRFKWEHLNERLAYERAVHHQRLRTEISQVKKETNFYIQNVECSERMKKLEKKGKLSTEHNDNDRDWDFRQKETEEERVKKRKSGETDTSLPKKKRKPDSQKASMNQSFLQSIFSGGVGSEES